MSYPSLEQYNEVFQHPQLALIDPELKVGTITTTGLGLPLALCGGFALTYTLKAGPKKFAVRCFHKQSNALEKRYGAISNRLNQLNSPYFVNFEFQSQGVRVSGAAYPIVKMTWASGITLGEFLDQNYNSRAVLQQLGISLRELSKYLEAQGIAHGDIQPGNVMVADGGKIIQLIDYDGMFVDDLRSLGSAELGHRNFQHPQRSGTSWNPSIDRFSFIAINLALQVLEVNPELWGKTQSDGDAILFKANDFADPSRSSIFRDLFSRPKFAQDAKNFAAVCKSSWDKIPSLDDFISQKNIPQAIITVVQSNVVVPHQYLSAYPVLDALSYANCLKYVGDKVELIGRIVEVKADKGRNGKSYIFINFGDWRGSIVKINIWSEGLKALANKPTAAWEGKWISVVGLIEPPYVSKKYKYSHLSISITQSNQIHLIGEQEARFRLGGSSTRSSGSNNQSILKEIHGKTTYSNMVSIPTVSSPAVSPNQAILQKIKHGQPTLQSSSRNVNIKNQIPISKPGNKNCFIATAIYGGDAPETNLLRAWRDENLIPNKFGRFIVNAYYLISPLLIPIIERYKFVRYITKKMLHGLIIYIK